jgi:hypothetical protein
VNESIRGRIDVERFAKGHGRLDAAPDQRDGIDRLTCRPVGHHPQRNLRAIAVQALAKLSAARSAHQHRVTSLRANISHVCTVNPRMTAAQPLLTTRVDHHGWQHVGSGLSTLQ